MKILSWMVGVALALTLVGTEPAAQSGSRSRTSAVPSRSKVSSRTVPESSLGSAERRALLGGKSSAASKSKAAVKKPTGRS
jgi:hypothetical protein